MVTGYHSWDVSWVLEIQGDYIEAAAQEQPKPGKYISRIIRLGNTA
jgi:hypothetical protein